MRLSFAASASLAFVVPAMAAGVDEEFFEKQIRPVLAARCYACHSEKSKPAQGGLLVDSRDGLLRGGKSGVPAVTPGNAADSLLIRAVKRTNKDLAMPPGPPLADAEIAALEQWIQGGAPDPRRETVAKVAPSNYDWAKEKQHWAFQPVRDPKAPAVADRDWNTNAIDQFVRTKLGEKKLAPRPRADKYTLIRRAAYDLTGLPPTEAQVREFVADRSPEAFAKLVDRLLESPAYGEHWGRHWLDVVRYADTAGDASDFPIPEMYRYRNYVIRSFNADKPYDLFLREQVAGDTMTPRNDEDRIDKLVATSYLAASRRFGQTMGEFHLTIDDTIDNLGKTAMGLSLGCARCHDHKFDPLPTADYYAIAGILESSNYAHAGLEHHQYLEHLRALDPSQQAMLDEVQTRMVALAKVAKKGGGGREAVANLNKLRSEFPEIPMAFAVTEGKPVDSRILVKGDTSMKGPAVPRGFLTVLGGEKVPADYKGSGRELLAKWLTDSTNPLTARVMVNRVWQWHFGRGLVNTPNDFGKRGSAPSHPELLDWLAARFVEDGWSMKKLHRRMMLTRVYQSSSGFDAVANESDPANQYYWRFNRRRLTAEELRDSLLLASGRLDPTPGGPHPFPPRASYRFTQHKPFVADLKAYDTNRRSVYLVQQRFRRHPYLELFDGPDPNNSTPARGADPTALQSLYFMNSEFVHAQAEAIAQRSTDVDAIYRTLFARAPKPAEKREAEAFLAANPGSAGLVRVLLAGNEFSYID